MSVRERILKCFKEVTGISSVKLDTPLSDMGVDSLETLDLLYTLENEFNIRNLDHDSLTKNKKFSLSDLEKQLLQHLNLNTNV